MFYIVAAVVVFICAALALSFFPKEQIVSKEPMSLTQEVYYVERENSKMQEELREIGGKSLEEMLENAVLQMRMPSKNEALAVAIPEQIEMIGIALEEGIAKVNLSANYSELKKGDEMFCRAALVWTLTGFYFVDGVELLVDGVPLKKANGDPFGAFNRNDLIVNVQIEAEPTNVSRIFKLYFSNSDATALVVEERQVEVNNNQRIEKYIMEQLIAGPKEEGNWATVPPETKIRDIVTQDKICYVDLSQEFVSKHSGGSAGEILTIYSIVNSLCELKDIEKVQFLIEGEKQEEFKGHIEFGKPFEPKDY